MSDAIILSAAVEIQGAATGGKPRRLRVLAYSGGLMRGVAGYGDVVVDLKGLKIPSTVTVLADHVNALSAVLGAGKPTINDGRSLEVLVTLAENDQAAAVLALLESGVELQASVGVSPVTFIDIAPDQEIEVNKQTVKAGRRGAVLVTAGILKELTIIPLGADSETDVRIAARKAAGVLNMAADENDNAATATMEAADAIRLADLTRDHPDIRAKALSESWDVERVELECLRAERADSELQRIRASRPSAGGVRGSQDSGAEPRDILASAVLIHGGHNAIAEKSFGTRAVNMADSQRSRTMLDIMATALRLEHRDIPRDRSELIRAAFSTISMPIALGSAAEKLALESYKSTSPTWRTFVRVVSVRNFRATDQIRPIFGDGFETVGGGGELKYTTVEEQTFRIQIDTAGRMLGINRQQIINDDLGLFDQTATALGRAGAQAVSDTIYQSMLTNLEFDGSTPFFTEARESLIVGAGTVLSLNALTSAISALRRRTDPKGRNVDITPKVLLVPPELEATGRALLSSTQISRISSTDNLPQGNPLPALELAIEPRLSNTSFHDDASALAWYLCAGPADGAVSLALLDGRDGPVIERVDQPPELLGIAFRAYLDLGAALSDYRAICKMKGAV